MIVIALIAAAEAMLYSASRSKRGQGRRQQILMGNSLDSVRALPFVDDYLKRKTADASRVQVFVASKLAEVCRRAVHTRSFEYLLLHVIRTAILKRQRRLPISHLGVTLFHQLLDNLKSFGEVEFEIVSLNDHRLGICRGCKQCFAKGEEFCPLNDDRDVLIERMMMSDGVVFASPNYSFNVSATMKMFLDRLGFVFHRPRFFGKTFTSIISQGIYGGDKIVNYLDLVGGGLGFNTVKGCCITAFDPMTEKEKQRIDKALAEHSRRFYESLMKPPYPVPTSMKLWAFRTSRTTIRLVLDDRSRDYTYYKDKGWFQSDYYYPTRLGLLKKAARQSLRLDGKEEHKKEGGWFQ